MACRFGGYGGSLTKWSATQLCVHASKAALASASVDPAVVETSIVGNVMQTSADAAYIARHVALKAGLPLSAPALTVNRLCGSGFQALISVAQEIQLGEVELGLAAGTESMSQSPLSAWGQDARFGTKLGAGLHLSDTLWAGLTDAHAGTPMGVTAENLAADFGITRAESDAFALGSQEKWAKAHKAGVFRDEIAPIHLKVKGKEVTFETDEHPRHTSLEKLGHLPTTFKKDGVVTPGSASGICDGAAALVLASEAAVAKHGLKPFCEVLGWAYVGCEPTRMGIGPVPAIKKVLGRTGLTLADMDAVEINEAFAPQALACARELGLDASKLNKHGGAIALGHPLGASGARIATHLAHLINRGDAKLALGAACIGGGQGIALLLKKA